MEVNGGELGKFGLFSGYSLTAFTSPVKEMHRINITMFQNDTIRGEQAVTNL